MEGDFMGFETVTNQL